MIAETDRQIIIDAARKYKVEAIYLFGSSLTEGVAARDIDLGVLGTFLHNIYTGIENILKQILQEKTISIPHTASSHKDLLALAVSENVISQALADDFSHFYHFAISLFMPTVLCCTTNLSKI